eukprot:2553608-Rhodomonas_salina.2
MSSLPVPLTVTVRRFLDSGYLLQDLAQHSVIIDDIGRHLAVRDLALQGVFLKNELLHYNFSHCKQARPAVTKIL